MNAAAGSAGNHSVPGAISTPSRSQSWASWSRSVASGRRAHRLSPPGGTASTCAWGACWRRLSTSRSRRGGGPFGGTPRRGCPAGWGGGARPGAGGGGGGGGGGGRVGGRGEGGRGGGGGGGKKGQRQPRGGGRSGRRRGWRPGFGRAGGRPYRHGTSGWMEDIAAVL